MFDMNSGYDGYSMSKRAVEAYVNGEKPYSKWKKSDILERLKEHDTSVEYDFLKKLPLTVLKKCILNIVVTIILENIVKVLIFMILFLTIIQKKKFQK